MWCRVCQQDVPAVAAKGSAASVRCARCGEVFGGTDSKSASESSSAALRVVNSAAPPAWKPHDWQLEEELREAQRLVRLVTSQSSDTRASSSPADERSNTPKAERAKGASRSSGQAPQQPHQGGGTFGWVLSGLGLSGLVCGCTLLVWSLASGRDELWTIGLPTALISQVVLICGILLRRDDSTSNSERTSDPATTLVQVQASQGGMQPSGLSVHFANTASAGQTLDTDQLRREIEAVMQRQRAA